MFSKHLKRALSLLLTGMIALTSGVVSAGAVTRSGQDTQSTQGSIAESRLYLANATETIPEGKYCFYNLDTGTIMQNEIDLSCSSIPSFYSGFLDEAVNDTVMPEQYFFTVRSAGNGYYTIQGSNGRYLDIKSYGVLRYVNDPSPLKFTRYTSDGTTSYQITKEVDGKTQSLSMYSDSWYTVHEMSAGSYRQLMRLYKEETSAELRSLLSRINGIFDPNDATMTKFASGVTASDVKSLVSTAASYDLPKTYSIILKRANDIADGKAVVSSTLFIPERKGAASDHAKEVHMKWFATDRQPTGLWTSPGEELTIFVEAGPNDPMPKIMFTQHISDCHEEKVVQLRRGCNVITTPVIHNDFSTYKVPTVEPGGLFYIINPYTKEEQSDKVKLYIFGGVKVPTYSLNDDEQSFLKSLREYYTHYKNGEAGYHNCVELYSKYSYITLTLERAIEAYIQEGLSPKKTLTDWDSFIDFMMAHAGMSAADYKDMYLGVKVNQPYAGAYSTPEMICIQDNNWLGSFLAGRYGWGFPHEVGHSMDDNTREYTEITNNMWSMKYVLENNQYDSICVSKQCTRYDMTLIAPEDQNDFWLDENRGDTHYFWQLPVFWDLEVYHNGYWAEVEKMFRNESCGNSSIDQYLKDATLKEKFSAYSSKILGIDLTYYFKKYGYLKNESQNYNTAISMMNLDTTKKPKIYYYNTTNYNSKKISNVGKGSIEITSFDPSTNKMYFSVPESCVEGHLGFEIVKNGRVMDFRWSNEYTETSGLGTYTVNAYDTQLNVYSSITFDANSFVNKAVASVNGTFYSTLKDAVDAAPDGGIVYLLGSTYISSPITVSKNVTLKPASDDKQIVIINRMRNASPFTVAAGGQLIIRSYSENKDDMVVFDNEYYHYNEDDYSAYPYFDLKSGSKLALYKGVTVQNCYSSKKGSVINADSASITLGGCKIIRNRDWYEGTIALSGSSDLTCNNGTLIRYNKAKKGAAIYSGSAEAKIQLTDTEISDNFNNDQDGATISLETGRLIVGSGTTIKGNADNFYGTSSAVFVGIQGSASFSGKLNITDNVDLTHSVSVDPGITGKLRLRADRTVIGNDLVLATPSGGSFTANTFKAAVYSHNVYHLAWRADALYLTDKSDPKAKVTMNSYSIDKGKSVTITGTASEGVAPYQYMVEVKQSSASSYTTIKSYSTTRTKTWKPALTGSYTVRLTVKDATGATATDAHTLKVNAVIPTLKNTSTISTDTITLGGSIKINCSATGGVKPYKFSVSVKRTTDKSYRTIKSESTTASANFKPAYSGKYNIAIKVKDAQGKTATRYLTLTVKPKPVATLVNKSSVSASSIELGNAVKITGAATGGTKAYKYAVYYRKSTSKYYTTLRKASTLTTAAFNPKAAGTYYIKVRVSDAKGKTADKVFSLTVKAPLKLTATVSAKNIVLGKYVTVKANASGGTASYKYAFYYKSASSKYYSPVRNYSTAKTANIKPKGAGKYNILVRVKDAKGKVVGMTFTITVTAPLKNNSTISATAITLGKSVKITGKASGGTKYYRYAFYYKKSTASKYTKLRNYSIAENAAFKPTSSGKYNIIVIVKDAKGEYVRKLFSLTVRAKLTNKSTVTPASLILGKSFTVNAAASGGLPTYKYAVYYKNDTAEKYTTVKGFSTAKTATIKPKAAGKYDILVTVKDKEGSLARKKFTVTVKPGLKNKSTISAAKITLGKSVVIKAAGYGGLAPYKYAVYYKKSSKAAFSELRSYSTKSKITFKPKSTGTYTFKVKVKDARGRIVAKLLTLKVVKKA